MTNINLTICVVSTMSSQPHFMSLSDFLSSGIFSTQANVVQYCIQSGILQKKQRCSTSQSDMYLIESDQFADRFCWTCPSCPLHRHSIRNDSILEKRKIENILPSHPVEQLQTAKQESVCPKTVRSLYVKIRYCMVEDLRANPPLLGRMGKIVEIDESMIGNIKYNRGRLVKGKWLLGRVERGSNNCFLVECENNHRDHHTIIPIIKRNVRPGTLIITDGWKAYLPLSNHGFLHEDVNRSRNFVDPITGAHTNTIEGCWFHVKKHLQRGVGWLRSDPDALALNLAEFMWKKRHRITTSAQD